MLLAASVQVSNRPTVQERLIWLTVSRVDVVRCSGLTYLLGAVHVVTLEVVDVVAHVVLSSELTGVRGTQAIGRILSRASDCDEQSGDE